MRPCLGFLDESCNRLTAASRCPEHARMVDQARGSKQDRGYGSEWHRSTQAMIEAEPWCHHPGGCNYPETAGTPANPLSGQHIVAKINGGTDDLSNRTVWCRSCNSAESASLRAKSGG